MTYETSPLRVVLGLTAGALVGGLVFWTGALIIDRSFTMQSFDAGSFLMTAAMTAAVWLVGIVLLACPLWLVLHWINARGPLVATTLGATVSFLFFFSTMTNWFGIGAPGSPSLTGESVQRGLEAAGWMTLLGALVGLVVWRVAYRKAE